jgi:hypothetical protein
MTVIHAKNSPNTAEMYLQCKARPMAAWRRLGDGSAGWCCHCNCGNITDAAMAACMVMQAMACMHGRAWHAMVMHGTACHGECHWGSLPQSLRHTYSIPPLPPLIPQLQA